MNHKYKYLLFSLFCFSSSIFADDVFGHGQVDLSGEILESACTIDMNSFDQTIDFGITPISTILKFGESDIREFSINLVDCRWGEMTQNNYKGFDIVFSGYSNDQYFLVSGEAKGIELRLNDYLGKQILPGQKVLFKGETSETIVNKYSFKLITNGEVLKPGLFSSLIHYSISYN
jgi:type 1 fimbria pilin